MDYQMRYYNKLKVWQSGMQKAANIYNDILYHYPGAEKLGLKPQIFGSIFSAREADKMIPSERIFSHNLEVALVSTFEFEAQLLLAKKLGIADSKKLERLTKLVFRGQQGLCRFIRKLNR